MGKDTQEALERLEKELLAEEQGEEETLDYGEFLEEPEKEEPVVYQNFSNHYGADLRNHATGYKAYHSDRVDTDLAEFSRQVRQEPKPKGLWLLILTVALAALVVAYILYVFVGGLL